MSTDSTMASNQDFASIYGAMSDLDITRIAAEGGLRAEAEPFLRSEMHRRSIGAKEVRALRLDKRQAELQSRVAHNPNFGRGNKLEFRSRKYLNASDETNKIITVTRWLAAVYLPMVPLGSYRISEVNSIDGRPKIIGKVPLQWDQVMEGWRLTALWFIIIGIILMCLHMWQVLTRRP